MDLETLLQQIADGRPIDADALLPHLCREDRDERLQVNLRLADAYSETGAHERAGVFVRRAWVLSGFSPDLIERFVSIHAAYGDAAAIREAYKRLGMRRSEEGDLDRAIESFYASIFAFGYHSRLDRYEYDFDILDRIERMARPYRFRPRTRAASAPDRKIRVAYLTHLLSNPTSVFYRINLSLAEHHDPSRFEVTFFSTEPASAYPDGKPPARFDALGYLVVTAPEAGSKTERLVWLGTRIAAFRPDLLVTNAALSDLDSYFVTCLRPAPATLGLVYGPPPQFTAPGFDGSIASARHPLIDTPGPCAFVPVEVALPDRDRVEPLPRRRFDLPDDAVILLTGGRPVKFQDRSFWEAIFALLRARPAAWFVAVGVRPEQLPAPLDRIPADLEARVRFLDWQEEYPEILTLADVVIDTYPSGGGLVLMDAMALGRPVVSFRNDYLRAFDQTDWSVAMEFVPIPELIVPRGDFEAFHSAVTRLIDDEAHRRRMAERCRETIFQTRGQPQRMVRGYEEVYRRVATASAGGDRRVVVQRPGWRRRWVPWLIRWFPPSYPLLQWCWRFGARVGRRSRR